jgi:hypothetical protein
MLASPNPTELRSVLKAPGQGDIARHRRVYCVHYDRCLDLAIERLWRSWTCEHCLVRYLDLPQGGYRIES